LPTARERIHTKYRVTESGCWEWQAGLFKKDGYGQFHNPGGSNLAHRAMWEFERGPVPEDLQLDHLCRNRRCVNPDHLEPVPGRVNLHRGETVNAANTVKTHCIRGHEFTPENTYRYKRGTGFTRKCKTCINNRVKEVRRASNRQSPTRSSQAV
jgi:hypothetical protein